MPDHQFKSEGVDECLQYGVVFYHPRKNHLRRVFHQQEVGDVQSLTALSVGRHLLQQVRACGTPAYGPFNICSVWHHLCAEASVRQRLCARGHIKGCISDGLRNRFFAVLRMTKGTQNDNAFHDPPFGRGMEKKRSCDFRNSLILNLLLNQDLNLGPSD